MKIITQTERLFLREFTIDDAIHFYDMNNDPDVINHTGDNAFKTPNEAKDFIRKYNQYKLHKMGRWAVCLKNTNEFLGWCGLKFRPDKKLVDVGYRFYKKHWNNGYATESAKASIEYGFKTLKISQIYAHAHIENVNSHKVIDKCGMEFIKEFDYDGIPANFYKIDNPYLTIRKIKPEETYEVRHPVLREGRPIEDCKFDNDDAPGTFHLGLFIQDDLLGIVTYLKNNLEDLQGNQYQLRGMAILKKHQKRGFGNLLIKKGEDIIKQENGTIVWCNAREIAVDFYIKNGFKIIGKPFVIPKIGLHYVMYKNL